jgi:dephospho-CoA kinase
MLYELGLSVITEAIANTPSDLIIVDGIRVPLLSDDLRLKHGAKVVALDCPPEIRYERIRRRGRKIDKLSFEDFLADEEAESFSTDPFEASTLTVIETADYHIDSSKPFPRVVTEVDDIVVSFLAT